MSEMNECGCCKGLDAETPIEIYNRPGLKAISYRIGTHPMFKQSMLAGLSASRQPALRNLNTREDDDFSIALVDAWAVVADVLTFYQERIANEAYLRTATENISLLHLARLIGYELRPGVAASTYLAFMMKELPEIPVAPGALLPPGIQNIQGPPTRTTIDAGTRVQSIPGPGEYPQIFETIEKIEAQIEWNAMMPRLMRSHPSSPSINMITINGLTTNLKPGDSVLLVGSSAPDNPVVNRVKSVVPDIKMQTTRIELEEGSPIPPDTLPTTSQIQFFTTQIALTDDVIKNEILSKVWKQDDLLALAITQKWSLEALEASINKLIAQRPDAQPLKVFALRVRASLFGHNAPRWDSLPIHLIYGEWVVNERNTDGSVKNYKFIGPVYPKSKDWDSPPRSLKADAGNTSQIYLDNTYPSIVAGYWLVLENSSKLRKAYKVNKNTETTRSDFGITAKVTQLELNNYNDFEKFNLRETTVLAQSEKLDLVYIPLDMPVQGSDIILDRAYLDLKVGQKIIITGERTDLEGITASEVKILSDVSLQGGYTVLKFTDALTHTYVRDTVRINANVAAATHGETTQEVLGSGDASQMYQHFTLRQPPLTYISASIPGGAESTLQVRVNNVLWHEVPTLYGHGPNERIFITRTDDDGRTTVQFGDGKTGARLPTGQENVRTTYRRGIGVEGLVKAGQLSLLMTHQLGVQDVSNPLNADGAGDRETGYHARRNAPLVILTLDRIVSLKDYEDFTRAYPGISKSLATWTWDGQKRGVFVTVAGPNGSEIRTDSILYKNLLAAMQKAGDASIPLRLASYRPALFKLEAIVRVNPDFQSEKVLDAIRERLRSYFSFDEREFGQPVTLSEVMAVIQSVEGVIAVNITKLYRSGTIPGASPPDYLVAAMPEAGADITVAAAELLTLDPGPQGVLV